MNYFFFSFPFLPLTSKSSCEEKSSISSSPFPSHELRSNSCVFTDDDAGFVRAGAGRTTPRLRRLRTRVGSGPGSGSESMASSCRTSSGLLARTPALSEESSCRGGSKVDRVGFRASDWVSKSSPRENDGASKSAIRRITHSHRQREGEID